MKRIRAFNPGLGLLLGGQLISQVGDKFYMLAVAYFVLQTTGSPGKMGLVLFCTVFPSLLLGIVAGAYVDRYDKKTIIVGADLARGLIVSGVGICFLLDVLSFPVLLMAQVLLSVCTAFFDPAIPALIPQLVEPDKLTRANSQVQLVKGLATILGPALGGFTVAWVGFLPMFAINAGSYLFSAGFESLIPLKAAQKKKGQPASIGQDMWDGVHYVLKRQGLLVVLVLVGLIHWFVGSIETVIPVLAIDLQGDGATNIGFIQTSFGFGSVVAALVLSWISLQNREATSLFGSVFGIGLLLLAVSGLYLLGFRIVWAFLPAFLGIGGAVIIAGTSFRSIIQQTADERFLGRVFGLVACVGNISLPLAMLGSGFLMESIGYELILMMSGLFLLPTSLLAYRIYMHHK